MNPCCQNHANQRCRESLQQSRSSASASSGRLPLTTSRLERAAASAATYSYRGSAITTCPAASSPRPVARLQRDGAAANLARGGSSAKQHHLPHRQLARGGSSAKQHHLPHRQLFPPRFAALPPPRCRRARFTRAVRGRCRRALPPRRAR